MSTALHSPSTPDLAREQQRRDFLARHGHADTVVDALPADASARRYFRLNGCGLLLMDSPPAAEPLAPYLRVANLLCGIGLSAPKVIAAEEDAGLALIEDFGHSTYTRLFQAGHDAQPLYELAVDSLATLHAAPSDLGAVLPGYDQAHLAQEYALFTDWYIPLLTGSECPASLREQYMALFAELCAEAATRRDVVVLRDFHVDNLMLIDGRQGVAACGLLDFQDALHGAAAYDLMSLLQDARRDVPQALQQHLLERYLQQRPELDRNTFMNDYAVLAAQRHAKVLGIFVRLGKRDGKLGYLDHLPRVQRLFAQALEHPILHPLRDLLDREVSAWRQGPSAAAIAALRTSSR